MEKFEPADSNRKSVIISANPNSGSRNRSDIIDHLKKLLVQRGFDARVFTDIEQVVDEVQRLADEKTLRSVVSAGGDGTAALLVNRLPRHVPLTILPLGTANLLAGYLQMKMDASQVADVIENARSVALDVGRANGRIFLVVASCGFDADVVETLHKNRTGHIRFWTYSIPILRSIWNYRYPRLQLTADGKELPSARWAFVMNVPRYAMNLNFVADANAQDGHLDICTFEKGGLLRGLYYLFAVIFRQHEKIRASNFVRFKEMTITSDEPVPFEIDGDPGGELPLTIKAVPEGMRVLVPGDWSG